MERGGKIGFPVCDLFSPRHTHTHTLFFFEIGGEGVVCRKKKGYSFQKLFTADRLGHLNNVVWWEIQIAVELGSKVTFKKKLFLDNNKQTVWSQSLLLFPLRPKMFCLPTVYEPSYLKGTPKRLR